MKTLAFKIGVMWPQGNRYRHPLKVEREKEQTPSYSLWKEYSPINTLMLIDLGGGAIFQFTKEGQAEVLGRDCHCPRTGSLEADPCRGFLCVRFIREVLPGETGKSGRSRSEKQQKPSSVECEAPVSGYSDRELSKKNL